MMSEILLRRTLRKSTQGSKAGFENIIKPCRELLKKYIKSLHVHKIEVAKLTERLYFY